MSPVAERVKHEIAELIPVFLFFFVAFHLLAFTEMLALDQYGVRTWFFVAATVGALIVAKVVLIADHFKFVNRFPRHPLVYNVIWKTAIYFVASVAVRYVEQLIHAWRSVGSFTKANDALFHQIAWPHLIIVHLWLLILLLVFCTVREFVRAMGRDRVISLFFRHGPQSDAQPAPHS